MRPIELNEQSQIEQDQLPDPEISEKLVVLTTGEITDIKNALVAGMQAAKRTIHNFESSSDVGPVIVDYGAPERLQKMREEFEEIVGGE